MEQGYRCKNDGVKVWKDLSDKVIFKQIFEGMGDEGCRYLGKLYLCRVNRECEASGLPSGMFRGK